MKANSLSAGLMSLSLAACTPELPEPTPNVIACSPDLVKDAFDQLEADAKGLFKGIVPSDCSKIPAGSLIANANTGETSMGLSTFFPDDIRVDFSLGTLVCEQTDKRALVECATYKKWVSCGVTGVLSESTGDEGEARFNINGDDVTAIVVDDDVLHEDTFYGYGNTTVSTPEATTGVYVNDNGSCDISTSAVLDRWKNPLDAAYAKQNFPMDNCYGIEAPCTELISDSQTQVHELLKNFYPTVFSKE